MKNYLCIMRYNSQQPKNSEPPSPSKMEEMYAKFNAWKEEFNDNILDMGGKLGDGKTVSTEGVTDGPFAEAKEIAGGYMIVKAEDISQAVLIAQKSPGLFPGSSVEVREIHKP